MQGKLHTTLKLFMLLAVSGSMSTPGSASGAEQVSLTALPNKCISLRQGQVCYQGLELSWQTQERNPVCLWREGDKQALRCWTNENSAKMRYSLSARESAAFLLVAGKQQDQPSAENVLARTSVKVAWIYNSRKSKRTRWRLF